MTKKDQTVNYYECYDKAKKSIKGLVSLLSHPDFKGEAIERLYSIALLAIQQLEKAREEQPDLASALASTKNSWPYVLSPGKGWVKTRMPQDVREILYELGLGSSPEAWPVSGREDFIGRLIKMGKTYVESFRTGDIRKATFGPFVLDPTFGKEDFEFIGELPPLNKASAVRKQWAKAVFKIVLCTLTKQRKSNPFEGLADAIFEEFKNEGGKIIKLKSGYSEIYDKSPFFYSVFFRCSKGFLSKKKAESLESWEICEREVRSRFGAKAGVCALREETEKLFKRRHRLEIPDKQSPYPNDVDFKREAIDFIAGRLKSMT